MAARRMNSIIAILLILVLAGFVVICSMGTANAMVDPSPDEENAKTVQTASTDSGTSGSTSSDSSSTKKTKKSSNTSAGSGGSGSTESDSNSDSDSDDEDVVEENAFSTPGNASLGDVIRDSDSKDFYTIKTDNDNTYYLVIDHAGSMDNVYMLSTIDEEDLKDFLEENSSGSLILPETQTQEEALAVETQEPEPEQKNNTSGIISLAIIVLAAIGGGIAFMRYRRRNEEPEDDYSEGMEDDGIPTINEDEEFLK